ncbi:MAG TPA: hypothetical protein VMM92_09410, partial [Thermoanaerobaculia bacterium]|nr:hypothetical protein [Thermoanaerobaculia bacterium]
EEGEASLRDFVRLRGLATSQFLLLRHAVESAFVALRAVREDVDFVVESAQFYPIDRVSGRVDRGFIPQWLVALEASRGLPPRPRRVVLNQRSAISFLGEFQHISGTSGTILEDGLEFLLTYRLSSMRVEPRFRRAGEIETDLVFRTRAEAHAAIVERVLASHEQERPVLIGCQTIADAEDIHSQLQARLPPEAPLDLLTARNDSSAAEIFERAGEPGRIVVATQLAGRGVDIRLTAEVRARGGLDLIGAGHGLQHRHDRQFLGRAGRQGDPFRAAFFCSLEDELMRRFGSERIKGVMGRLGMEEGEAIEHKMVDRAIRRAQNQYATQQFLNRRSAEFLAQGEQEIYTAMAEWFYRLQCSSPEDRLVVGQEFLREVVEQFIARQLTIFERRREALDQAAAQALATSVTQTLACDPLVITPRQLEGHELRNVPPVLFSALWDALAYHLGEYVRIWNTRAAPPGETEPAEVWAAWARADLHQSRRTLRRIVYWNLQWTWTEFLDERLRIHHRLAQLDLNPYEFYRSIADRSRDRWRQLAAALPDRILQSLMAADQFSKLDPLFLLDDHRAEPQAQPASPFTWSSAAFQGQTALPARTERLVDEFITANATRLGAGFPASHLRRLLDDFLREQPISSLQSPHRIQAAIDAWAVHESERGVESRKRTLRRRWLGEFLRFLRAGRHIGPLPTVRHRLVALHQRVVVGLRDLRTVLPLTLSGGVIALVAVAGWLGNLADRRSLAPPWSFADAALAGGWVARGNLLAPAATGIVTVALLVWLLWPWRSRSQWAPVDALLFQLIVVCLAAWMAFHGHLG